MKANPDTVPDTYSSLSVVQTHDIGDSGKKVDITKCITSDDEVYFHVNEHPPDSEITEPDDIITITSFTVGHHETVDEVERQARASALEHYADTAP